MAKYGSVVYNQTTYGQKSRLAFSVSPFTATALDYGVISLQWSAPAGGYAAFRLLRNQDAFSETVEDGIVLYEEFDINLDENGDEITTGVVSISSLIDSAALDVPRVTDGKYAYYTVWLLKASDKVWYQAGQAYVLAPNPHPTIAPDKSTFKTTHQKFMDLIPRVFSSESHAPIDEPDYNSDLSVFLKGFSFTIDEFLSELDSLLPNHQELRTSPEIVSVKANQLGLPEEGLLSLRNQKKILRDALYVYSTKGTATALNTVAEDLTGYAVNVSVSENLMLSAQDSTFYKGLGFWLSQGSCTLSLEDVTPVTNEPLSIDSMYSAKVIAADASAAITNGMDAPVTKGVPVAAETSYSLSLYSKMGSSTGSFTTKIHWYDFQGTLISTSTGSATSVDTTWTKFTQTATSPADAVYAAFEATFSAGTYYLDMVQMAVETATDYSEARCVNILLEPTKSNFISNPSFEATNSAWTTSGTSTVTYETLTSAPQILEGTKVLQVTEGSFAAETSVATNLVATGTHVTFSIYGKTTAASEDVDLTVSATNTMAATEYAVSSNVVTLTLRESHPILVGDEVTVSSVATAVNGTYTVTAVTGSTISYAKTTADVDPTAATGTVSVTMSNTATVTFTAETAIVDSSPVIVPTWSRGQVTLLVPGSYLSPDTSFKAELAAELTDTMWFDAAQLENSYRATDYVDGNYSTERDALWGGTPNNSPSYVYPNKIVNVSRFTSEVEKYLPFNTPWIVSSYSSTEASGIS
jgi:hypothetical protein